MGLAEHPFFTELLIVLVIATIVAVTFERFRLPATLGFLMAGVFIGPHGLALVSNIERIQNLAELGIIFLLLTIGIEFSFERLRGLRRIAILGGTAQIVLTIAIAMGVAHFFGWAPYEGFILGSVIALSSTAIVLKYLIDRGELASQHGKIAIAILVFQDIAFVLLLILAQTLGQPSPGVGLSLGVAAVKAFLFIGIVALLWRFVLVRFLEWVASTRNREIFLLAVIVICFGGAFLSASFGLSMAIGAFFVGFMLANTPYGNQVAGEIVPFRHVFVSLFFVSLGLLFNPAFMVSNLGLIFILVGLVLVVNFTLTTFIVIAFGRPPRVAVIIGLMLAQIGEFSFLILETARHSGSIDPYFYQVLLSVAFITIFATPFLFNAIPFFVRICEKIPLFGMPWREAKKIAREELPLENHVIICGYGLVGRDLVIALQQEGVPYVVLELNPKNIQDARHVHAKVIYGDATNEEVMRRANIVKARAVVVSFAETFGMLHIVRVVQNLNPDVTMIVRSRFEKEVPNLYELGVDMVVMEELEASLEVNRLLLENFKVPQGRIEDHLKKIRTRKELAIEQAIFKRTTGLSKEDEESPDADPLSSG